MTFLVNSAEDRVHFLDFVSSILANVGVSSKLWQGRRNSLDPSQLICLELNFSSRVNKSSPSLCFKLLITIDFDIYLKRKIKSLKKKTIVLNIGGLVFLNYNRCTFNLLQHKAKQKKYKRKISIFFKRRLFSLASLNPSSAVQEDRCNALHLFNKNNISAEPQLSVHLKRPPSVKRQVTKVPKQLFKRMGGGGVKPL